jgi:hypothetical protein
VTSSVLAMRPNATSTHLILKQIYVVEILQLWSVEPTRGRDAQETARHDELSA